MRDGDFMASDGDWDWQAQYAMLVKKTGLTQKEIAEKIGISRSYYNQLMMKRRPLTPDMRLRLMNVFQELSGKETLSIWFDYVRIRFPTHNAEALINKLIGVKVLYWTQEEYGLYGYSGKYKRGDMEVFTSPPDDNRGTLLELKGKGCRQLEGYLEAQKRDWYDFFAEAFDLRGHFCRLDVAINDYIGVLSVPYYIEKCKRGEFVSKFRGYQTAAREKDGVIGETLYLGSRKSEIYFCLYQKDAEQFFKHGTEIDDTTIKNRFEIRTADDRADTLAWTLVSMRRPQETVFGVINQYLRFVQPNSRAKDKWPLDPRWQNFISGYPDKIRLATAAEEMTLEKTKDWIQKQVAPTLKMLMAIDNITSQDELMDMIRTAELSDKHHTLIEQFTMSIEESLTNKYARKKG